MDKILWKIYWNDNIFHEISRNRMRNTKGGRKYRRWRGKRVVNSWKNVFDWLLVFCTAPACGEHPTPAARTLAIGQRCSRGTCSTRNRSRLCQIEIRPRSKTTLATLARVLSEWKQGLTQQRIRCRKFLITDERCRSVLHHFLQRVNRFLFSLFQFRY